MGEIPEIHLLVVDDEEYICEIVRESLASEPYHIVTFTSPSEAIEHLLRNPIDLVLTDLVMGEYSGIDVVEATLQNHRDAIVILMTAHPTVQTAISVLKRGAYDVLIKPFKLEALKATIRRGLAHQRILRENVSLKSQMQFLKASGAFTTGVNMEHLLRMIVTSVKTELGASAAALFEVDPEHGSAIRSVHEADDSSLAQQVLQQAAIQRFRDSGNSDPIVDSGNVEMNGVAFRRSFISSPILIRQELHGVINLLVFDRFRDVFPAQLSALTMLTHVAASAIANQRLYNDLQTSYLQAIRALANAIEARDTYTAGHTDRVTRLAELVARHLGWDEARIQALRMGCALHDIGKIGVPDSILNKPSGLTSEERQRMIDHPTVGLKIVSGIDLFRPSIPYIISHHERYDGTGYPKGLKGEGIPIEGRLLAVVDMFDAVLSNRPYRSGAPLDIAVSELLKNRGVQFDPFIVDTFIEIIRLGKIDFVDLYDRVEDLAVLDRVLTPETVRV